MIFLIECKEQLSSTILLVVGLCLPFTAESDNLQQSYSESIVIVGLIITLKILQLVW